MKKIILLMILIAPFIARAQEPELKFLKVKPQADTIRCVMLVSDTTMLYTLLNEKGDVIGYRLTDTLMKHSKVYSYPEDCRAIWIFGYKATIYDGRWTTIFLNEMKKPLRKSILIWSIMELHE